MARGVRDDYADHPLGAPGWYRDHGSTYRNPHDDAVAAMVERSITTHPELYEATVLDLAAGSGEVSQVLLTYGFDTLACDPFTTDAFMRRLDRPCEPWSFEDIAHGALVDRTFSAVICSYALHLCEPSWLPVVCAQLALATDHLVIITPHKRPMINESWGWHLDDEHRDAGYRVRLRHYSSR
jgi:hypothetical protein